MSITTERARLADVGLVLRRHEQWKSVFDYTNSRPVDVADLLVAHIAVVTDPGDLLGTEDEVMRKIERIGIARFPNTGYSYNGAAFNSGRLYEGQPLERRGAHTVNDRRRSTCSQSGCPNRGDSLTAPSWNNNVNARALVAPQMPGDPVTDIQARSFARWGAGLKLAGFARSSARWHGHRCFAAKDCPSPQVWARLDDIEDLTADYVRAGHVGEIEEDDMPYSPTQLKDLFKDALAEASQSNGLTVYHERLRIQAALGTREVMDDQLGTYVSRQAKAIATLMIDLHGREKAALQEAFASIPGVDTAAVAAAIAEAMPERDADALVDALVERLAN